MTGQPHITAAIVGLGYWGPNLLRNFAATPNCIVKYGCDLVEANLAKQQPRYPSITFTTNYQSVLSDGEVDLVIIATKTATHYPLAKAALEAGKHVFIEKPMCSTAAEAAELNGLALQKNLHIFVDHTFVFAPAVELMQSYVQQKSLGELLYFDSTRINLGIIQHDTNVLWDLAIHDLSILNTLVPMTSIETVYACGHKHYGQQIEDAHLHMHFRNNFHAHIHVSWLSPVKIRQTLLAGSSAMLSYDDTEPSEKVRLYDKGLVLSKEETPTFLTQYRSGDTIIPALPVLETLHHECTSVVESLLQNVPPKVSGDDGLMVLKILEAADASMVKGATISLI